jgi:hypothetical protein
MQTFKDAVARIIKLQGSNGEWAWFYDASRGAIVDWYQIYSVHQDAMSLLFLFPALELGVPSSSEAIRKSYTWLFGQNEINARMIDLDPFFIRRSIRRKGSFEREKRFFRSMALTTSGRDAKRAKPNYLEINPESRSYHIGWILYVWAGRSDFKEFTNLELFSHAYDKTY